MIIMLFLLTESTQNLKLEKFYILKAFCISLSSSPLQGRFKENANILSKNSTSLGNITISRDNLLFLLKKQKKKHSSESDWWENTKSSFRENARTFSKNSTTQENIRVSRLKEDCKTYTKKEF